MEICRIMPSVRESRIDIDSLYRYYYRPLCLYALHYIGDAMVVEDIVQDSFIRLWEKSSSVHISDPKPYLYMTVRNRCLDLMRKSGVRDTPVPISDAEKEIRDEELQEDSYEEARLWTAIDSLPSRCREVFLMSRRDGLKYSEISEQLGISENTVRNQMSKALRVLKEKTKRIVTFLLGL